MLIKNNPAHKTGNVYVESHGCSANFADGEVMAGCLQSAGYCIVSDPDEADVLIYNTCAVKTPTENRMFRLLKNAPSCKKLIVGGCLPLINLARLREEVNFQGVIGPSPGCEIVNVVRKVEGGKEAIVLKRDFKPSLSLPRFTTSTFRRIIPISYGCVSNCSYCAVRFARGKLRSHSISEIVDHIKKAVEEGISEIWLTAQDLSCYGEDIGVTLLNLLEQAVKVKGKFYIRLGMMNPSYVNRLLPDLIKMYKEEKIFQFLHLPVQSGDNEVLKLMNRKYSVEEFKQIISCFRSELPRITVSTDIICGFPGEDDGAFKRSIRLLEEVKPNITNLSKFHPRPGTLAENMKPVSSSIVKNRSRRLAELSRMISLKKNKEWLGWAGDVFVDEVGKYGTYMGRNFAYRPVVVNSEDNILGKYVSVKISGAFHNYLKGDVL
ncbi:MAG: tRNA (N(6)-L-threonylcarbamoyladenosine(37)-C(2))-methylthiotransferase [Candidatus Bathyarchaeota archaeon]